MDRASIRIHCLSCGIEFRSLEQTQVRNEPSRYDCPTCHYQTVAPSNLSNPALSPSDFQRRLSALVQAAWGSVLPTEIVSIVRDELEFVAELAHTGRRVYVQIIDLGPHEQAALPTRDRKEVLQSRSIHE